VWQRQFAVTEQLTDVAAKELKFKELYRDLESNLDLIGASALEDMLQENVPDCIHDFRKAGINVWMLTGDKFETAESIGYSCKLFN